MNNFDISSDYRLVLKRGPEHFGPGLATIHAIAAKFCVGTGLDVGASSFTAETTKGLRGAVPVDILIPGSGDALALLQKDGSVDYVFSSHCYEHLEDPERAAAEAYRVLKPGGVLFLYLPFPGHSNWDPQVCATARGEHKWQPTPSSVSRLLLLAGFGVEYCEWEKDQLSSFVVIGRKAVSPNQ